MDLVGYLDMLTVSYSIDHNFDLVHGNLISFSLINITDKYVATINIWITGPDQKGVTTDLYPRARTVPVSFLHSSSCDEKALV